MKSVGFHPSSINQAEVLHVFFGCLALGGRFAEPLLRHGFYLLLVAGFVEPSSYQMELGVGWELEGMKG